MSTSRAGPSAAEAPSPASGALLVAYAVTFIAFFDTFALLPTVGPYAEALGATGTGMGVAVGAYSATNLIFNVVGGVLLDRAGRRRLALAGFVIAAGAIAVYPLASTVPALVAVRLLHGVGGGILIPAVYTLIGDLARSGARGRAMGLVGVTIGAAAVIAPGISGAARSAYGFDLVFLGLAGVMLAGLALTAVAVKETATGEVTERARGVAMRSLLAARTLQMSGIAVFGFTFGFGSLAAFLPSRLEGLGRGPALSGGLFTLLSLVAAALMLTRLSGRVDRRGPRPPILTGLPLIAVALAMLALVDQLALVTSAVILFGAGFGIVYPAVSGATAIAASPAERGRAFGLFNVAYSLGFVVGPPLAGYLGEQTGVSPFAWSAVVCLAALAAVATMGRNNPASGPAVHP